MKYKWIRSPMGGYTAELVGKELENIQRKRGVLTPEILLAESTPKKAKLHNCFEWDDSIAAQKHRLEQAGYILRAIEVVFEKSPGSKTVEIRAFQNVDTEDGESVYVTYNQALKNEFYLEQIKEKAMSEIRVWKAKYKAIKDFEQIIKAIDDAEAA